MRCNIAFDVIYAHTEGEPTCIIHSGIFYPSPSSILEKRGFSNIFNVIGGTSAWISAGYEVDRADLEESGQPC